MRYIGYLFFECYMNIVSKLFFFYYESLEKYSVRWI